MFAQNRALESEQEIQATRVASALLNGHPRNGFGEKAWKSHNRG
jgi:hypothetical protein